MGTRLGPATRGRSPRYLSAVGDAGLEDLLPVRKQGGDVGQRASEVLRRAGASHPLEITRQVGLIGVARGDGQLGPLHILILPQPRQRPDEPVDPGVRLGGETEVPGERHREMFAARAEPFMEGRYPKMAVGGFNPCSGLLHQGQRDAGASCSSGEKMFEKLEPFNR